MVPPPLRFTYAIVFALLCADAGNAWTLARIVEEAMPSYSSLVLIQQDAKFERRGLGDVQVINQLRFNSTPREQSPPASWSNVFEVLDRNRDGVVDRTEFATAVASTEPQANLSSSDTLGMRVVPQVLVNNNLGGLGPVTSDPFNSMIVANAGICGEDGDAVSLVIENTTAYRPGTVISNRLDRTPAIDVMSGTDVTLRFRFVSNRTGLPMQLSSFTLTFLDLDCNSPGYGVQQILAGGFESYAIAPHETSTLVVDRIKDGRTSFKATTPNRNHSAPNHMDTRELSPGSVSFTWRDVSSFMVTLQVQGPSTLNAPGRTFRFTGPSFPLVASRPPDQLLWRSKNGHPWAGPGYFLAGAIVILYMVQRMKFAA